MTHKLKTETFSRKIELSDGVIVLLLTPLFSFVTVHLNSRKVLKASSAHLTNIFEMVNHPVINILMVTENKIRKVIIG